MRGVVLDAGTGAPLSRVPWLLVTAAEGGASTVTAGDGLRMNRENVRYHPPSIDVRTLEARRLFESLLPVVPSAGMLFEF